MTFYERKWRRSPWNRSYALLLIGAVLNKANNGIINGIELSGWHPINSFFWNSDFNNLYKHSDIKINTNCCDTKSLSFYERNYDYDHKFISLIILMVNSQSGVWTSHLFRLLNVKLKVKGKRKRKR